MFEHLKKYMLGVRKRRKGGGDVNGIAERAVITAGSAGMAGSVAAVVTTPIDVVKTRIMLKAMDGQGAPKGLDSVVKAREKARGQKDMSGWRVGKDVWRKEGLKGLFRGGLLRAVWTAMGSGLYLGAYESGRHWLERRRGEDGDSDVF